MKIDLFLILSILASLILGFNFQKFSKSEIPRSKLVKFASIIFAFASLQYVSRICFHLYFEEESNFRNYLPLITLCLGTLYLVLAYFYDDKSFLTFSFLVFTFFFGFLVDFKQALNPFSDSFWVNFVTLLFSFCLILIAIWKKKNDFKINFYFTYINFSISLILLTSILGYSQSSSYLSWFYLGISIITSLFGILYSYKNKLYFVLISIFFYLFLLINSKNLIEMSKLILKQNGIDPE
jgi:hypothetical protein